MKLDSAVCTELLSVCVYFQKICSISVLHVVMLFCKMSHQPCAVKVSARFGAFWVVNVLVIAGHLCG